MILVLQRVSSASVDVSAENYRAEIGRGLMILLGVEKGDTEAEAAWAAEKVANLRIFEDAAEKMNLSLIDVKGAALVVSQFTLAGDTRKGRRPGFDRAAPPDLAKPLYEKFCALLDKQHGVPVKTGIFQAMMRVTIVNEGPVTFIIERRKGEGPAEPAIPA
ncbi:MAG: D-tyrosyl-tRNA(Tyr) deacylase [Planctomycetes bacterium]|nr:D-tyrosyl-tRNA(Tyr) deacylase [Planctomycetota bacterium]